MSVSGVQNPYDPAGWVGRVEVVQYPAVNIDATASFQICPPDPYRLWLLVAANSLDGDFRLWPYQQTVTRGIEPGTGVTHVLIHNASYPGAVQGAWYAIGKGLADILYVIAGRAIHTRGV